jgi:hypothetical protein
MNKNKINYLLILLITVVLFSCKKASIAKNETEHLAINRIELILKQAGTTVATVIAEDPDGDGGNPPSRIDQINLQVNKTYDVEVKFINIINGVTKDITPTIQQQGREHEVFFVLTGLNLPIQKTDVDGNGFPIGLKSVWVTGSSAASGSVLLKLMHKPLIKGANDSHTKGHSDIAISFQLNLN